jgi:hypothetical protein
VTWQRPRRSPRFSERLTLSAAPSVVARSRVLQLAQAQGRGGGAGRQPRSAGSGQASPTGPPFAGIIQVLSLPPGCAAASSAARPASSLRRDAAVPSWNRIGGDLKRGHVSLPPGVFGGGTAGTERTTVAALAGDQRSSRPNICFPASMARSWLRCRRSSLDVHEPRRRRLLGWRRSSCIRSRSPLTARHARCRRGRRTRRRCWDATGCYFSQR